MHSLDVKGKDQDLLTEELEELYALSIYLSSLSKLNNDMQRQKSHLIWLKEGGANSKFFHCIM